MLCTCSTRREVVDEVESAGRMPPPGAPSAVHVTLHEMVAVTA